MPRYPAPSEYQEALQFPATAFTDAQLQEAEPEATSLGLPRVITGAFAAVFPVRIRGERYALKCFLSEVPDQQARYRAVARYLGSEQAAAAQPYVVPFTYAKDAVRVGEGAYPLLKMGWVEGVPLNRFVAVHRREPDVLRRLAADWAAMAERLHDAGLAHGDLQHGNVLVVSDDTGHRLVLVDYDTMYVPVLRGKRSPEVGHRNYQHPDRGEQDYGPWIDRFPALVVYTALLACALHPELWDRYDTGENLLFRASDFFDSETAPLLKDLDALPELRPFAQALRRAAYLEPEAVPTLSDVLAGRAANRRSGVRKPARAHRDGRAARQQGEPAARTPLERAFLPLTLVWIAAVAALASLATLHAALFTFAAGLALLAAVAFHSYRHTPVARRRRRLDQETGYFRRIVEGLQREVQVLQTERQALSGSVDMRKAERLQVLHTQALENRLKHHFVAEVGELQGIHPRVVTRLKYFGIRNAFQATEDHLAKVLDLSPETRVRVSMWRAGLVSQYAAELPDRLSPSEERRMERYAERRKAAVLEEVERLRQKIAVQEEEAAQIRARRQGLPEPSPQRYLRFLLRLSAAR